MKASIKKIFILLICFFFIGLSLVVTSVYAYTPVFQQVSPNPTTYPANDPSGFYQMTYSGSGNVTDPIQPVDVTIPPTGGSTSGCEATDFAGFVPGNIALIQRGTCTFHQKAANAQAAGAVGVIIFNEGNTPDRTAAITGTLSGPGINIPVIGTSFAIGQELYTLYQSTAVVVHMDIQAASVWTIDKSADQTALTLSTGETFPVNYTVTVDVAFEGTVDNCIEVTDTLQGSLGTVCIQDAPKTFTYTRNIGPYDLCGDYTVDNTASFVTSDTGSFNGDIWTVDIHVPCNTCRSAGFWGTHAGTECPKKQPNCGSQNITQDVITAAGGCLAVCGQEVTNTALKSANSAVEAICVSPLGDIEVQLARQLTAATLNCVMSNSTATTSCSNGDCKTCGSLTVPGQDINIGTLVTACNDACIGSTATATLGGVEVNCIDALNCFNNGGVFNAGAGPSTATCQTGTCSIDNSPCGIEGLPSCPTVIVGGIAQSQTCVPLPDNCASRPLCQVAIPGNATSGTPGTLCFDAINADVECPQPPAAAPAICTPAPGPAGSVNECNSAIKNQCTIEGGCTTGNGATCPSVPVADIQVTKGVANAPLSGVCDNTLTYGPTAEGIESGSCPNFCYKIVVSNDGAESVTSIMVSDPDLPGLTVPSTLAPGQSVTLFASKTWCAADAPAPDGHVNTVTASGVGTPSDTAVSASASATVVVQGPG